MICSCGETTNNAFLTRGKRSFFYRYCPQCGRELADEKACDLLDERFKWDRVGWYQDTLAPLTFLESRTRMYDLCLLIRSARYIPIPADAEKYLHGLIRADGSMIFRDEEKQ